MARGKRGSSRTRRNVKSTSDSLDTDERASASGSRDPSHSSASAEGSASKESTGSASRESAESVSGSKEHGSREPPQHSPEAQAPPAISEDRQKNFVVRPGFAYFLVTIPFTQGQRFGLGVKDYRNQVIVSKVEDGSMAADTIKVLDRVCDVCSMPVTDKDVCKTMIVRALKFTGEVDMIIERPMEPEAIQMMENALNASRMQEPSVAMAPDVKSIIRRYQEKLKLGHGQMPARKAMTDHKASAPANAHVGFQEKSHISLLIGCDRTPSQVNRLQKVKPKMKKPPSSE